MLCVKNVCIQSYSGPYFPAFGLNEERYSISLRIQSECGKIRNIIAPNTYTFYAVIQRGIFISYQNIRKQNVHHPDILYNQNGTPEFNFTTNITQRPT